MSKVKTSGGARQTATDVSVRYEPYFSIQAVYFQENSPFAFLNNKRYTLKVPSIALEEDVLISVDDLELIYRGRMQVAYQEGGCQIHFNGRNATLQAGAPISPSDKAAPEYRDGVLYAPVDCLMGNALGMAIQWEQSYLAPGIFIGIAEKSGQLFEDPNVIKDMLIQSEKLCGTLQRTYYYQLADRLMPYRLYVPSTYSPDKPSKLVIFLHGAGPGSEDSNIERTNGQFELLAEQHNYILLSPNGYCHGFYGGWTPDLNPEDAPEEEQPYLTLCEMEPLHAIEDVCTQFSIDRKQIFLSGNSMGGGGTFFLSMKHRELFRAVAPCGAMTTSDICGYDLTKMKGLPLLLVIGTENIGYVNAGDKVADMVNMGVDATLLTVGGGLHANAWITALPDIFKFFEAHSEHA